MSDREKLIELIWEGRSYYYKGKYRGLKECDAIAKHLISNGVTLGADTKPLKQFLTQIDEYAGLKLKFLVFKADTGERVENCFVLRPDKDAAAVEALRAYAEATDNKTLAEDIYNWVGNGVTVQKWIPVSERLPQEDEPEAAYCDTVQVLLKSGEVTVGWCNRHFGLWYHLPIGETYFVDADYVHTPVVAWKPLAEPPKECE